jgi:hypothetical protein
MDIILKIIIGTVITVIATLVLYAFRVRQLYLLIPKMFGYSGLTGKGKVLELRVFNRGRSMEEDVYISMPPALTYDLIAADSPDVRLDSKKLVFSRISPRSEVSIVLLAEGAVQSENFEATLNSKTTKGKIVKKLEDVPPNAGSFVLSVGGILLFLALGVVIPLKWLEYQTEQRESEKNEVLKNYSFLEDAGWRQIDRFIFSDARASYAGFEFPILFNSAHRKGNNFEVRFFATNKTSAPLKVYAFFSSEEEDVSIIHTNLAKDILVQPMQTSPVVVSADIDSSMKDLDKLHVEVRMQFGELPPIFVIFSPSLNKASNQAFRHK